MKTFTDDEMNRLLPSAPGYSVVAPAKANTALDVLHG